MKNVAMVLLSLNFIGCGSLQVGKSSSKDKNKFHVSIQSCSEAGKDLEFTSRDQFCAWALTDTGKSCLLTEEETGGDLSQRNLCGPQ